MTDPNLTTEWMWAIAIIVFGLVLAYGVMRGRRPKHLEKASKEATDRHFDKK